MSTLPVPRNTFTRPSPEAAEPMSVLPERSTVKFRLPLHAIAILPSIFSTSSWRLISISSSLGQGHSSATTPLPLKPRLNKPSPPATAEDRLDRITALCVKLESQARNRPSSRIREPFQSDTSSSRIYL